jgi:hypothetical protein
MTREPLLYIAAPFRGDIRANVARANAFGRYYASLGYHVVVPHNMSRDMDPFNRLGNAYWLACTANMLRGCTHIVLTPGWEDSEGCRAEKALAEELGLEVWEVTEE